MAFIPIQIGAQAGEANLTPYSRAIQLTERQLTAFAHEAGDLTEPFTAVAGDMRTQVGAAFATQGSSGASGKWVALSPQYAAWKGKRGPGLPILVGLRPTSWVGHRSNAPGKRRNVHQTYETSGRMMAEMLMPLADHATWQITPQRLRYTPTSDIAGFHETGTDKMPPRPPLDLSVTFLHSVDRQFVRWLAGVMRRNGL